MCFYCFLISLFIVRGDLAVMSSSSPSCYHITCSGQKLDHSLVGFHCFLVSILLGEFRICYHLLPPFPSPSQILTQKGKR